MVSDTNSIVTHIDTEHALCLGGPTGATFPDGAMAATSQ